MYVATDTTQSLTGLNARKDIGIIAIPTMPNAVPMLCRENPNPPATSMRACLMNMHYSYTRSYIL